MGLFDGILDFVADVPIIGDIFEGFGDSDMPDFGQMFDMFDKFIGSNTGRALGAAGTGLFSAESVDRTNQMNLQIAREGQAFNADQVSKMMDFNAHRAERAMQESGNWAQAQMGFQKFMSDTSYLRAKQDLEAAGMNPMLALMKGGASTPAGAAGSGVSASGGAASAITPRMENAMLQGLNTGMQAATFKANLEKINAETDEVRSRTAVNAAQVPRIEQETRTSTSSAANLEAHTKDILERLRVIMPEQHAQLASEVLRNNANTNLTMAEVWTELERTKLTRAEAQAAVLHLPRLRNEAAAQKSWWMESVSPFIPDATRSISSGAGLARSARPWRR